MAWFASYLLIPSKNIWLYNGISSSLELQSQKASNTSRSNWKRKWKYSRILEYDSKYSSEYLRAQNIIYKTLIAAYAIRGKMLLNQEFPVGTLSCVIFMSVCSLSAVVLLSGSFQSLPCAFGVLTHVLLCFTCNGSGFFSRTWKLFCKTTLWLHSFSSSCLKPPALADQLI